MLLHVPEAQPISVERKEMPKVSPKINRLIRAFAMAAVLIISGEGCQEAEDKTGEHITSDELKKINSLSSTLLYTKILASLLGILLVIATILYIRKKTHLELEKKIEGLDREICTVYGLFANSSVEIKKLKDENEALKKEHEASTERLRNYHETQIDSYNSQMRQLNAKIQELTGDCERLKQINTDNLRCIRDASMLIEAREAAQKIQKKVQGFLDLLDKLRGEKLEEGEFFLLFSVNPDLTEMMEKADQQLSEVASLWCGESNPDREANAAILIPIVSAFESIRKKFRNHDFKTVLQELYALAGKVELLHSMTTQQPEAVADSLATWQMYLRIHRIPTEWYSADSYEIYDFFAQLGIAPVASWSEELKSSANKKYREIAQRHHPDKKDENANPEIFLRATMARDIFSQPTETQRYLNAITTYKQLFN